MILNIRRTSDTIFIEIWIKTYKKFFQILDMTSLYPIQKQAISNGLLKGENLLVTSPTASGKH